MCYYMLLVSDHVLQENTENSRTNMDLFHLLQRHFCNCHRDKQTASLRFVILHRKQFLYCEIWGSHGAEDTVNGPEDGDSSSETPVSTDKFTPCYNP